jgi:hypothetical protein
MIKVEMIFTDDLGNKIVASTSYDNTLLSTSLDEIEALVLQAKSDLGKEAEHNLLKLNQSEFNKKKANFAEKVRIR